MKASRPSPSTVSTPERMFRRMSSASSRTRLSSMASVSCSIPASRSRWPSTATIAKTTLNTTICAQKAASGAPARVQKASPRKSRRGEHRGEGAASRRHQQRVGRHHQDVERGEGRLRLAREVHDRGDDAQVHQRLDQQEARCRAGRRRRKTAPDAVAR